MTVCVATMAVRSRAIVLVADKAVTYQADDPRIPAIWGETDIRKIHAVGRWRVLVAGDPAFGERVIGKMTVAYLADKNYRGFIRRYDVLR